MPVSKVPASSIDEFRVARLLGEKREIAEERHDDRADGGDADQPEQRAQ